jgi:putative SOS response-associated peptidase YedK
MTTSSNEAMKPLHNRMSVILDDADWPACWEKRLYRQMICCRCCDPVLTNG